ncbi:hypothetical protein Syun_027644 [Stephania yunnanensis]|uniref:Uncharacterized protein n=1 Tax=Stephania yunnanensis TaxID=152371 RepID=A0AAP0ELG6_9MAGN
MKTPRSNSNSLFPTLPRPNSKSLPNAHHCPLPRPKPKIKEATTHKFTEYLRRAEEVRAVIDDWGARAARNGDAAMKTKTGEVEVEGMRRMLSSRSCGRG